VNVAERIVVRFYSILRLRLKTERVELAVAETTIKELLHLVEQKTGQKFLAELLDDAGEMLMGTIILVNGKNIRLLKKMATKARGGDTVDLISPVGGG